MNRLKSHRVFLEVLTEADEALFKAIIKSASDERIDVISEICKNVLAGVLTLTPANKTTLAGHANIIRGVASKRFKTRTRRQLITKYHAVIVALLKAAVKKIFK